MYGFILIITTEKVNENTTVFTKMFQKSTQILWRHDPSTCFCQFHIPNDSTRLLMCPIMSFPVSIIKAMPISF